MSDADSHALKSVVLADGRSVTILVALNHLCVADDQGVDMSLAHHTEALACQSLVADASRIKPGAAAAMASFEGSLAQAVCAEFECDNGDAQGFTDAHREQWVSLALAGATPAETAKMLAKAE